MSDSLGDQIAARLLHEIVAGVFAPGSTLPPEWELAEREGASRLTIREAVRVLRQKSVVRIVRGRGTFIQPRERWSPLDPAVLAALANDPDTHAGRVQALLEARTLVEVGVAGLAAARRSDADIAAMRRALEAMRIATTGNADSVGTVDSAGSFDAAGSVDSVGAEVAAAIDAFVAADLAFHDAVLAAAANPVVAALYEPIAQLLQETRRQTSRSGTARAHAVTAHERILDAITRRHPGQASWAMRDHLAQTAEDFASSAKGA